MTNVPNLNNAGDASVRLADRPKQADFVEFQVESGASVASRFAEIADRHADRDAIRSDRTNCTYRELQRAVNGLASTIIDTLGEGSEPVIVLVSGDIAPSVGALGVMTAGKIHIPIDRSSPAERIRQIGLDSGARLIITDHHHAADAAAASCEFTLDIDSVEPIDQAPDVDIDPEQVCRILYTSGSTGAPKGVTRTHAGLLASIAAPTNRYGIAPRDRIGMIGSTAFAGSISDMFLALLTGACLLPFDLRRRGLAQMRAWMRHDMPTTFYIVPSVFRAFVKTLPGDIVFGSVNTIRFGGEQVVPSDIEAVRRHFSHETFVVNNLGTTEIGVYARHVIDHESEIGDDVPAGSAAPGCEISIIDDDGQEVGAGARGCIVVRTRTHSRYWNDAVRTGEIFRSAENGYTDYRTGDRGYLDDSGVLHFLGRSDRLMKVRGNRVESGEVEIALRSLDMVDDVAVVGVDVSGSTAIAAYVVSSQRPVSTDADLRAAAGALLPDYAVPTMWIRMDDLPRTNRGKIDWDALPEPDTAAVPDDFDEQITDLEQTLIDLWAKELKVSSVGLHDDFFDLGGTSLDAMSMFAAVNNKLGYDIAPTTLMGASTVSELASVIESGVGGGTDDSLIPLRVNGTRQALYVVHGGGGGVFFVGRMLRYVHEDRPLYGLQAAGYEGTPPPYRTVPEMAERYVEEIRAVQPHGPYALTGLSLGGAIAWEMAQQLHAAGEHVSLLGLIDTKPVSVMTRQSRASIANQAAGMDHVVSQSIPARAWRKLQRLVRGCALRIWLMTGRPLPDTFKLRQSYFWPLNARAARAYEPVPYTGDVTIVSEQGAVEVHREIWSEMVRGALDVFEVPAYHLQLDREPHIGDVVRIFESQLQRVEDDVTAGS